MHVAAARGTGPQDGGIPPDCPARAVVDLPGNYHALAGIDLGRLDREAGNLRRVARRRSDKDGDRSDFDRTVCLDHA